MIRQIEEKVVNRLRQVTSAIRQAGANQVSVITSSAEREAAVEFAKAAAIRPATLGKAFRRVARDPAVAAALFEIARNAEDAGKPRPPGAAAPGRRTAAGSPACSPPPNPASHPPRRESREGR